MDIQFGLLVRQKRKERGVSIRELERITGVTRAFISRIENGDSIPSIIVICKLAKGLDIPAHELYWYK